MARMITTKRQQLDPEMHVTQTKCVRSRQRGSRSLGQPCMFMFVIVTLFLAPKQKVGVGSRLELSCHMQVATPLDLFGTSGGLAVAVRRAERGYEGMGVHAGDYRPLPAR